MGKVTQQQSLQMDHYSPIQSQQYTKTALRGIKPFSSDLDYIQMELEWLKLRCERFYYRNDEGQLTQRNRWHQDEEDNLSPEMIKRKHDLKLRIELEMRERINHRLAVHRQKGDFTLALDQLCERCELNDFHRTVILIISAPSFSSEFEKAFGRLMSQDHDHCPDVEMIFRFFNFSFTERIDYRREFGQSGQLIIHDLMQVDMHRRYRAVKDLLNANLEIDSRTFTFMIGRNDLSDEFLEFSSVDEPLATFEQVVLPIEDKHQILSVIERHEHYLNAREEWGFNERINYGRGSMMLFYGPPGTGKTMTAHAIAHHLNKRVFNVDIPTFISHSDADRFLPGLFREARLQNAVLFFDECEILFADRRRGSVLTTLLLTELERFEGVAIFATNLPEVLDDAFQRRVLVRLAFAEPDASHRAEIWRSLVPEQAPLAEDVDFTVLGARYEITGGYIKNAILSAVASTVHQRKEGEEKVQIKMADLENAARQQMKQVGTDPEIVVPNIRLSDVILESSAHEQIQRLISAVRHLPSVLRQWKIGGVGGDRGGVVGLLHGLPGTGKTLCAEAIAGELNRPLMVARSSTILSKWVGESERNLQKLFKEAKANGAVLFIDEADSMISQRDQSNSDHTRSLINLLLSLIERHRGVVLLATNFRNGLDSALERRITHQIELKRPNAEVRRQIWALMLADAQEGHSLDLDALAECFELSGAEIRVVILRAATSAFEAGESGLTQTHLEREASELLGSQKKKVSIGFGVGRGA